MYTTIIRPVVYTWMCDKDSNVKRPAKVSKNYEENMWFCKRC